MGKWARILLVAIAAGFGLLALAVLLLYQAAQREPEFYQQALRIERDDQEAAGDDLEKNLLDLHNEVRQSGTWEAVFTEEQVNGWLAADMPRKFPDVLPAGTQEPRVKIDSDHVRVACRFESEKIKTVISFAIGVDLTTETNTLAVRISKLRAGALPMPLKQFLDNIKSAAKRGGIPLRWSQVEGDPVALVKVPVTHEDYAHREIYLDTVQLRDGEIYLAGHTDERTSRQIQTASVTQQDEKLTVQR